jgi:hypothetical protein
MSGSRRLVFEKPILEEYWPDIDGLAQRHKVTDEPMPSQTLFDIDVIHLLTTYNQPSATTLPRRTL